MLFLAMPMTVLFMISKIIARIINQRHDVHDYKTWDDDEQSELALERSANDDNPNGLDESDD